MARRASDFLKDYEPERPRSARSFLDEYEPETAAPSIASVLDAPAPRAREVETPKPLRFDGGAESFRAQQQRDAGDRAQATRLARVAPDYAARREARATRVGPEETQAEAARVLNVIADREAWGPTIKALPEQVRASLVEVIAGMKAREFAELEQAPPRSPEFAGMTPEQIEARRRGNTDEQMAIAKESSAQLEKLSGVSRTLWQKAVSGVATSAPQTAAAMAVGMATRNPALAAASMFPSTAGQSFGQYANFYADEAAKREAAGGPVRTGAERERDLARAGMHADVQGMLEAGTEFSPFTKLFKPGSSAMNRLLEVLVQEIPGESVATITQSIDDTLAQSPEGATTAEVLTGLKQGFTQLPETWATTLLMSMTQAGGVAGIDRLARGARPGEPPPLREPKATAETALWTADETVQFAAERRSELEAKAELAPAEQQELDFLRGTNEPAKIAGAYRFPLKPGHENITAADVASPIPTDLIAEGHQIVEAALNQEIPDAGASDRAGEPSGVPGVPERGPERVGGARGGVEQPSPAAAAVEGFLAEEGPAGAGAPAGTLFAEWAGQRYPVASVDDAKEKWAQFRDESGAGASELGSAKLVNAAGEHVGTISYNGRFWPLKAAVTSTPAASAPAQGVTPALSQEGAAVATGAEAAPRIPAGSEPEARPVPLSDGLSPQGQPTTGLAQPSVLPEKTSEAAPLPTRAAAPAPAMPAAEGVAAPLSQESVASATGGAEPERVPLRSRTGKALRGEKIDSEWVKFSESSGSLGIPRDDMPQIKAEHRGALANFLKARGIEGTEEEVLASSLKPTQAEFSEKKVKTAKAFEGGDRAILVSSDNHVLDGHHQWIAKADKAQSIRIIRLNAPIKQLLEVVPEFPSAEGGTPDVQAAETGPVTWSWGKPDLSGVRQYTTYLRAEGDEEGIEVKGHHKGSGRDPTGWKADLSGKPQEWANKITALLSDGKPRTFNRIALELTGGKHHADVAGGAAPEKGLWMASEAGAIEWSSEGPPRFRIYGTPGPLDELGKPTWERFGNFAPGVKVKLEREAGEWTVDRIFMVDGRMRVQVGNGEVDTFRDIGQVTIIGAKKPSPSATKAPTEPRTAPPKPTAEKAASLRALAEQAGWVSVGGKIIRNEKGDVTGRTSWVPRADWWPGRPGKYNEAETAAIIEKGINGKLLGKSQRVYFDFLSELADQMLGVADELPTVGELAAVGLEETADNSFDMALVAKAQEIDENAVEQATKQFENDDEGFLRAIKAIVDGQSAEAPEGGRAGPRAPGAQPAADHDLFGEDTRSAQALADEQRRKDEARSGTRDVSIETGDPTDLFSAAVGQADLVQQAKAPPKKSAEPEFPADQRARAEKLLAESEALAKRPAVSKNAVFTDDAAARARALLKSKLGQITAGVDPEILQAGITLAGYHIEKGARTFAAYSKAMIEDLGEAIRPYLKSFYMAVKFDPRSSAFASIMDSAAAVEAVPEGKEDAVGVTDNLERDRGDAGIAPPADEAADVAGTERPAGGVGQAGEGTGVHGGLAEGDARVLHGGAVAAGERGDQSLYPDDGQRLLEGEPAGSDDDGRGDLFGDAAVQPDREGTAESREALERVEQQRAKVAKQKLANQVPVIPGDRANIDKSLPYLLDGQRDDVKKAEDRFSKPDGYGMLFTNGTGTGKTFTGLGVVRRFVNQGKKNILIAVPSDKIANDWIDSGRAMGLRIGQLSSTKDPGDGVNVTTFANLGQNRWLADRKFDLLLADEAHYLLQGKDAEVTEALRSFRALTLHPEGNYRRTEMLHRDLLAKIEALEEARKQRGKFAEQTPEHARLLREYQAKQQEVTADIDRRQGAERPRALFLSATPFAYEKAIEWASGYLFEYGPVRSGNEAGRGYNGGDDRDRFFMQHFGYRMRYNKLTEPDAKVDRGVMQRQFNGFLKKSGSLSGRVLDVEADYDRRFVNVESKIGNRIDAALEWLSDTEGLDDVSRKGKHVLDKVIRDKFDHLSRRYLLEAIKAEASIPYAKKHMALGRKVVVFHDFKKGGGFNPFDINFDDAKASDGEVYNQSELAGISAVLDEYREKFADLIDSDIGSMRSPIQAYQAEFPNVLLYNGDVPPKLRRQNADTFNSDATGPRVILVQSAAGKEGISLHDTTGKHQRAELNLGLPTQPTTAIQEEGRIYRLGSVTDALFRYFNTGTNWEKWAFATTIANRASAAENLAQGEQARALKDAFIAGFQEADDYPAGMENEGKGGKQRDRAANEATSEFDRAVAFYWGTEKKTARTKAREGADYFATPEPLGLKMMEWAGVRPGEKVLEPSAGHGAIARWAPTTAEATAIEPSSELASRLAMVFEGTVKQQRFEDLNIVNKYDAIAMNPPFGHGGSTAIEHLDKAVKHLRDRGRVVALIPTGPAADKKFDKWYEEQKGAYLAADIKLPQATFERAATSVMARIVVLDKVDDAALSDYVHVTQPVSRDLSDAEDIKALFTRVENMSVPDRPEPVVKEEPAAPERETSTAAAGTFAPAQTKHSKTGADLFVAKIARRLSAEDYSEAKARAKALGGWYSSFKGSGAIPGFQFKTQQARDTFIGGPPEPAKPLEGAALLLSGRDAVLPKQPPTDEAFDLGFFSALRRAADELKQDKGTAEQMLAMLRKTPGVKEDEIEWTGLGDYLKAKGTVTKQEIQDFLDQNGVQVEEVALGVGQNTARRIAAELVVELDALGWDTETDGEGELIAIIGRDLSAPNRFEWNEEKETFTTDEGDAAPQNIAEMAARLGSYSSNEYETHADANFEQYTLPGGSNYREVLLTLPEKEDALEREEGPTEEPPIDEDDIETMPQRARRLGNFRSSHFPQPNILAHVRLKDRTTADGKKVLFVEEIQSDWAQKGRREGFQPKPDSDLVRRVREYIKGDLMAVSATSLKEAGAPQDLADEWYREAIGPNPSIGVHPRAPFVESTDAWAGLAIKRVLRMAVDGGYDAVAWTTGEQQAERYDLSKSVSAIEYQRMATKVPYFAIEIRGMRNDVLAELRVDDKGKVLSGDYKDKDLADVVGKSIADKILSAEIGTHTIRDEGLKIGGEGMIGFYDGIVPKIAGNIVKKLGGKVGTVTLKFDNAPEDVVERTARSEPDHPFVKKNRSPQPAITLTPAMKASIGAGLPLFDLELTPAARAKFDATVADLKDRLSQVGIADRVALRIQQDIRGRDDQIIKGARGRYDRALRVIEIAMATADKRHTLDHEIIHALKDLGVIRGAEWTVLSKKALADEPLMTMIRAKYGSRNLGEEQITEEAIAEMHADWVSGKFKAEGWIKVAFERIRQFFEALLNAFRGQGFQSANDVFQRIGSGEVGRRGFRGRGVNLDTVDLAERLSLRDRPTFDPKRAAAIMRASDPPAEDGLARRFFDEAVFRFQDKFNYLAKVQRRAAQATGAEQVPEAEDVYLAELRYHGMVGAAIEDFQREHVDPLLEAISQSKIPLEDVETYLHARHAPEANAQLKRINPDLDDNEALSGMSDDEAAAIIDGFAKAGKSTALEGIAKRVDAITTAQRELLVSSGLEAASTIAKWEETYDFYVPLHREGFAGQATPTRGKGFSVAGRQKRRTGSQREVTQIIAQLVAQTETTIVRAHKNKVAQSLLEFAKNNPNEGLYEVNKIEYQPTIGPDGLVVYRQQRAFQLADNVVVAKVGGKDNTITFNTRSLEGTRIASSLKNLGADHSGPVIGALMRITRFLALVNTGANPEFIISNFARDLQTAGYNLSATEADGLKWKIIKDVGKAWRGIRAFQKGKGHTWAPLFDEFRKAGGKTGWMDFYRDVSHREQRLQAKLKEMGGDSAGLKIKQGLRAVERFIEDENTAVENAIRLSAFVHARRAGISEAQAARLAKELTVNFNRKGDYGQTMNALYLFYNASVQGSARILVAGAKSKKVRALMAATVVVAALLDIANRALGGDDDDGENRYDKIPGYVKERNLIIMLPEGRGDYLQIPLPWGYNVFHVIGQVIGEALTKPNFKPLEGAFRVGGAVVNAFNPIGGDASITQMVSPTITDPLVQWAENKDWTGTPLRPEGSPFDVDKPQSQQYWNSVREPSRWVTEQINELTGGSEVRPGAVDINPELIDLLIDTYTGGAGRFFVDTVATPIKALKGEEVEAREIPLLRRVYGRPGTGALFEDYYGNADAVRITEKEVQHFRSINDDAAVARVKRERPGEYSLIAMRRHTENQLTDLRQRKRRVEAGSRSDAEKRARIRELDDRIEELMNKFNRRYNERVQQ